MRIAIVGSREYPRMDLVREYVKGLESHDTVVSGGARGVDSVAENAAIEFDLDIEVFLAHWERFGKSAGYLRNQDIVDNSDRIVAFWDGISRGTADTIKRARKAGKPVTIFNAEGIAHEQG